ncbi:hypothetical protein [Phaeacidiphilus oryzae]|uniref:hypothetical protein n=1 Tax=Phaeacidiphilus oryzae TaxID=348818 RepID=UPI00055FFCC1|nr:hypothetical protein [Phaeacidiphilus oryzae]
MGTRRTAAGLAAGAAAAAVAGLAAAELRVGRGVRPGREDWRTAPVLPRGATLLGVSHRPLQAAEFGLDPAKSLDELLRLPFQIVRLAAYWNRVEPEPGVFRPDELDRQLDAVEAAGRRVVLCLGPVKAFGYPEFFVPGHHLGTPLPEGALIRPSDRPDLHAAGLRHLWRLVDRYRDRDCVIAWQVEHDAVDPLGMEHSWRLSESWVRAEAAAVRAADPRGRPVLLNGFLPTSSAVAVQQYWRTRDQGDSLDVARRNADIVGIDDYPRHAVAGLGPLTAYLDGGAAPWLQRRRKAMFRWAADGPGRGLMVVEGQAEPWETVTRPPDPARGHPASCPPERLIANYNRCLGWARNAPVPLRAYLFWGAEYWLLRARQGDDSYLRAARRVLEES